MHLINMQSFYCGSRVLFSLSCEVLHDFFVDGTDLTFLSVFVTPNPLDVSFIFTSFFFVDCVAPRPGEVESPEG